MSVEHIDAVGFSEEDPAFGHGDANTLKIATRTFITPAGFVMGSSYRVMRLRTDSKLHPGCVVHTDGAGLANDNLASGFLLVNNNTQYAIDSRNSFGGAVIQTHIAGRYGLMSGRSYQYFGRPIWKFNASIDKDPEGFLDIVIYANSDIASGTKLDVTLHYSF